MFTSRRNYGNLVNGDPYIGTSGPSPRKKLWVSAIDIQNPEVPYTMAQDITHPAFYLEGQELASGNMRGFWALDPCEANGGSCLTGDECCSGFCRQTTGPDGGTIIRVRPADGLRPGGREVHDGAGLLRRRERHAVHRRVLRDTAGPVIVARARGVG